MRPKIKTPLKERIKARVRVEEDGCWTWTGSARGARNRLYGIMYYHDAYRLVRRLVYEEYKGRLEGCRVASTCHNPLCVNPDHLVKSETRVGREVCPR